MIPGITAHIAGGPVALTFTERMQTFVGGDYTDATWTTIGLSTYGVPADAVCIFVTGNDDANSIWNQGVREVGSALSRFVALTEGESGGASWATFWVQADASSQVQIYTQEANDAQTFSLIGYFSSGVDFTERFDAITLPTTEGTVTLTNPGDSDIINIVTGNTNTTATNEIQISHFGDTSSPNDLTVNEAEVGGGEFYCRTVKLDTKRFEGYATTTDDTHDMGTISGMSWTPTLSYTDAAYDYTVATANTWTATTLTNAVVTPSEGDIVEIICRNLEAGSENLIGVRDVG